jgi:hypothetical protein
MKMKIIYGAVIAGVLLTLALAVFAEDKVYSLEDAYRAALGSNEIVKIAGRMSLSPGVLQDCPYEDGSILYVRHAARG